MAEEADVRDRATEHRDTDPATRDPRQLASVVITTCDRPDVVERALSSALAQTHDPMEVIVVDDGARDRIDPSDIERASAASSKDVRLITTQGREGANRARNLGLAAARGEWITFLDDDDELLPDMVARSLQTASESDLPSPVAVVSGIREYRDGNEALCRLPHSRARGGAYRVDAGDDERVNLAAFNTLVAPTAVMRRIGGFDEDIAAAMHTDLFIRVNADCSIQALPAITYHMHHHSGSRLSRHALERAEGMLHTWRKHRTTYHNHRRTEARYLANIGIHFLQGGDRCRSLLYCALAVIRDPIRPRVLKNMMLAIVGRRAYHVLSSCRRAVSSTRAPRP